MVYYNPKKHRGYGLVEGVIIDTRETISTEGVELGKFFQTLDERAGRIGGFDMVAQSAAATGRVQSTFVEIPADK